MNAFTIFVIIAVVVFLCFEVILAVRDFRKRKKEKSAKGVNDDDGHTDTSSDN